MATLMTDAPHDSVSGSAGNTAGGTVGNPGASDAGLDEGPPATVGIVVGVDLSPSSQGALNWAADTAAVYGVPLTVLVAHPDAEGDVEVAEYAEDLEGGVQTAVAGVRARHPDLVVHGVRYPTPPVQSLLTASGTAQLLVIGARGWEGFTGLLVGSTALNVVPYAKCPVVVVHPAPPVDTVGSGAPTAEGPHAGQVVLGYDGSVSANAAAAVAIRHAAALGTGLVAITVHHRRRSVEVRQVDPVAAGPGSPTASFWAPVILDGNAFPSVPITYWEAEGRPGAVLVEQSRGAQLLALGSRGRGGFRGLVMGSVSQQLLAHAPCPVGVLHSTAAKVS
jgi:nucleotide-binding universal stress UspA family protein